MGSLFLCLPFEVVVPLHKKYVKGQLNKSSCVPGGGKLTCYPLSTLSQPKLFPYLAHLSVSSFISPFAWCFGVDISDSIQFKRDILPIIALGSITIFGSSDSYRRWHPFCFFYLPSSDPSQKNNRTRKFYIIIFLSQKPPHLKNWTI